MLFVIIDFPHSLFIQEIVKFAEYNGMLDMQTALRRIPIKKDKRKTAKAPRLKRLAL